MSWLVRQDPRREEPLTPGIPRQREGFWVLVTWIVCCGVAWAIVGRDLSVPGLYYDEAIQAAPARDFLRGAPRGIHPPGLEAVTLAGRPFPVMTQGYMGALKSQALIPSFALFGATSRVLRASTLAWALAGLGLAMVFAWRLFGLGAALVTGPLLAFDPSFLLVARHDWGSFSLSFLLRCGAMTCVLAGWQRRATAPFFVAGLMVGLGVYNKVDFAVSAAALFGAVLVANFEAFRETVLQRSRWIAAFFAGGILGVLPMLGAFGTIWTLTRAASHGPAESGSAFGEKLLTFRTMLDGTYFERLMASGGNFSHLTDTPPGLPGLLGAASVVAAVVLLASALHGRARHEPDRAAVFVLVATLLCAGSIFVAPNTTRIHHHLALYPLPQWMLGLSVVRSCRGAGGRATRRLSAVLRGLIAVVPLAVAGSGLAVTERTLNAMAETGGRGLWSDALDRLSREVNGDPTRTLVCLDWGFYEPLLFSTEGPKLEEPIWQFLFVQSRGPWRHEGDASNTYLVFAEPFAVFDRQRRFLHALEALPPHAVEVTPYRDRKGDVAFLAVRVLKPHVLTFFGDFAIRLRNPSPATDGPATP